jgi:hypothetical protein
MVPVEGFFSSAVDEFDALHWWKQRLRLEKIVRQHLKFGQDEVLWTDLVVIRQRV